jgi:hypothetical protein
MHISIYTWMCVCVFAVLPASYMARPIVRLNKSKEVLLLLFLLCCCLFVLFFPLLNYYYY